MVFNSFKFLIFISLVWVIYFLIKNKYKHYILLLFSYAFYMFWKWEYGILLLFTTVLQYTFGRLVYKHSADKAYAKFLVTLAICTDLAFLFFFKYLNFMGDSISTIAQLAGLDYQWSTIDLILPLGISFYIFQTMSYVIDIYKKKIKPEQNFIYFSLYVSFFPQLIAGPIERASALLPQLKKLNFPSQNQLTNGFKLIILGLFKKMVIADHIAIYVDKIYHPSYPGNGMEYILATWCFMIQVYGDFSGYSDIAIGLALMFGIQLMKNFEQPFFAKSILNFWQRWHISLSYWVRDYIYIPLGGNRINISRTYINLFLSMFIIGIWHGAKWTVFWYAIINGISLVISKSISNLKQSQTVKRLSIFSPIIVFNIVCIPHVFFRSETVTQALNIFNNIFSLYRNSNFKDIFQIPKIGFLFFIVLILLENYENKLRDNKTINSITYALLFIIIFIFGTYQPNQFIYFQF